MIHATEEIVTRDLKRPHNFAVVCEGFHSSLNIANRTLKIKMMAHGIVKAGSEGW